MVIEHVAMYVNDLEKSKDFFLCLRWDDMAGQGCSSLVCIKVHIYSRNVTNTDFVAFCDFRQ